MKTSITLNSTLQGLASLLLIIFFWMLLAIQYSDIILPSPLKIIAVLKELVITPLFWSAFFMTMLSFINGLLLSLFIGSSLGI
ncbi:ABC-type nitrate/sulfonate/bicarbonate transport system permease component [Bacillus pakistanensis]|uniref:ABC-type nitrate/sulfonate/bicarbonate transport system permease component n=1 Tax=Rossellomorea pakistanensis TaxID=992288 RepID=A0ABS2NBY6_9BACI|nr:hypothetical protein [Bacillus pakistanensis]MBM7585353.1 ABC-type nitrate/sulfonate/bicarbonate transport system permease component [Bacillus pakistanensis]